MRAIPRTTAALAASAALLLAGCSQPTSGAPTPDGSPSAAAPSSSGLPALSAEPYRSKPCELLPATLPSSLGYSQAPTAETTGDRATYVTGQTCSWNMAGASKAIQVQIFPENQNADSPGLTSTFSKFEKGLIAYADRTTVSGYDAVYADLTDERPRGNCPLLVAVSATETVGTRATGYSNAQEACDLAKQLAEAAVKTLQGGS
ncbi:DUF3558 family protein [Amycolatopsis sacchari]|uniref:DUF3558 family protein n=1 Tax=Amycolatopsis sacchari TaxID=115433 RepID=UPI003D73CCD0